MKREPVETVQPSIPLTVWEEIEVLKKENKKLLTQNAKLQKEIEELEPDLAHAAGDWVWVQCLVLRDVKPRHKHMSVAVADDNADPDEPPEGIDVAVSYVYKDNAVFHHYTSWSLEHCNSGDEARKIDTTVLIPFRLTCIRGDKITVSNPDVASGKRMVIPAWLVVGKEAPRSE